MFDTHRLNELGTKRAETIRDDFTTFLAALEAECGKDGREMSIVRTKLEEASFFAMRAMSLNPDNQEV